VNVDKKHIVQLQGKDFITYDGLLDMAHQMGLVSIETELIDKDPYIFKAVAMTETQKFTGFGDADDGNVNKMIAKHKIRMAETRAKARALRDLTNVGMCSVEEMGGEEQGKKQDKKARDFDETFTEEDGKWVDEQPSDTPPVKTGKGFITQKQAGRLFAKAGYEKGNDVAIERSKKIVQEILDELGIKSTGEIKKEEYDEICEQAEVKLAEYAVEE